MRKMNALLMSLVITTIFNNSNTYAGGYTSKDLTIVHHPISNVATPVPVSTGLKVSAWVDRRDNTYRPGEAVKLFVRTNRDAYITIIDVGTSGRVHQIFPNAYQRSRLVKAHTNTVIPGTRMPYRIKVNGPVGEELIKVIASESPDPMIAQRYLNKSAVFPQVNRSISSVAKDLTITLNRPAHRAKAVVYNKVIHIR